MRINIILVLIVCLTSCKSTHKDPSGFPSNDVLIEAANAYVEKMNSYGEFTNEEILKIKDKIPAISFPADHEKGLKKIGIEPIRLSGTYTHEHDGKFKWMIFSLNDTYDIRLKAIKGDSSKLYDIKITEKE